ncbi:hypothetical protein N7508_009620 [Penicillium antarcticum]|uniref:uncharacterized protein n=1 Tax=Penicillium antarcticum TaxID=416450 RepID=UPI0023926D4E|nr:uncharacterized protein N7508_009620 [Penicillium antarcticum]KAJ5294799.1 hypothetical protein N7508_009620 [Penicillium antarcticum]
MNGPRPSTRVFLSDLSSLQADSKVRFLGCVRHYTITTGYLVLEHNYPRSKAEISFVPVDINAVLETLTAEELHVGTWLNVLGYIRESLPPSYSFSSAPGSSQSSDTPTGPVTVPSRPVHVEAIMVFPAGAIALGEYERILRNSQDVERMIRVTN